MLTTLTSRFVTGSTMVMYNNDSSIRVATEVIVAKEHKLKNNI